MNEEINVAETLAQIKHSLRQERLRRTTDDAYTPPSAPPLSSLLGKWAAEAAGLPERPTIADIPILKWLAAWPLVGPTLALAREIYNGLWLLTQKHAPWLQQVSFNMRLVQALQRLVGHVEHLEILLINIDRMQVDLNRRVYTDLVTLRGALTRRLADTEADTALVAQTIAEMKFQGVQNRQNDQARLEALEHRIQRVESKLDQLLTAQSSAEKAHGC